MSAIEPTPVRGGDHRARTNGAAYLAEIYRAGIEAIHRGQMEAALSLGMTPARRHAVHRPAAGDAHHAAADHQLLRSSLLKDTAHRLRGRRRRRSWLSPAISSPRRFQSAHVYLIAGAIYLCDDHPDVAARRPSRTHRARPGNRETAPCSQLPEIYADNIQRWLPGAALRPASTTLKMSLVAFIVAVGTRADRRAPADLVAADARGGSPSALSK